MTNLSITNAIKYDNVSGIRDWLEGTKKPKNIGKHLLEACSNPKSSTHLITLLLDAGADPNYTERHTYGKETYTEGPPLTCAAKSGSIEKAALLLSAGADMDYCAPHNFKVMNAAVYTDSRCIEGMVRYLVSQGADLDTESKYGESPLSVASRRGEFGAIKILLDAGADPSRLGWDAFDMAVVFGALEECKAFIRQNPPMNVSGERWERTPFLLAVHAGEIEKVQLLLKQGAQLDVVGRCDKTNLMYAVEKNNGEMLEFLISEGADIHARNEFQETALLHAAMYGATDCVRILLEAGADIHAQSNTEQQAIESATNIETVLVLKAFGADINRIGGDGYNLLLSATGEGNYTFVEQLLKNGTDPNVTSTGEIPLHKATSYDDIEIMKLLLAYGSNSNAQDVDGWTPLHFVKSLEAAHALIDAGADPNIGDDCSINAIDSAKDENIRNYLSTIKKKLT